MEFQDEEGAKYTLALEGRLSRDKVMKIFDLLDIMNPLNETSYQPSPDPNTFFGKLFELIERSFSTGDFSLADVSREYEETYNEPVGLSTIATYLSRLVEKGYLKRQKFDRAWVYRRVYLQTSQVSAR